VDGFRRSKDCVDPHGRMWIEAVARSSRDERSRPCWSAMIVVRGERHPTGDVGNAEDHMSARWHGRNGPIVQISTRERTWWSPLPLEVCIRRLEGATMGRVSGHLVAVSGAEVTFFGKVNGHKVRLTRATIWNRFYPTVLRGVVESADGGTVLEGYLGWNRRTGIPALVLMLVGVAGLGVGASLLSSLILVAVIVGIGYRQRTTDLAYFDNALPRVAELKPVKRRRGVQRAS